MTEKVREKPKVVPDEKEPAKKGDDKSSKKNGNEGEREGKPKPSRTSNGADYEKKREYQVKITEQKISYKETVRGKQPEARVTKISISSSSTPSRTPSPFLKPHERKDYAKPPTAEAPKVVTKVTTVVHQSSGDEKTARPSRKRRSRSASSAEVEVMKTTSRKVEVSKKDSRKAEKVEISSRKKDSGDGESRKRLLHDGSEAESITSEKSKRRKKKNRDGSGSEESSEKKKKHKLKKHKKSSKKSKKRDRSASREKSSESEAGSKVNEYLEKKLREKALVSLMRKNKKVQ